MIKKKIADDFKQVCKDLRYQDIQSNSFIMLFLGSIGTDCVISELCYKQGSHTTRKTGKVRELDTGRSRP